MFIRVGDTVQILKGDDLRSTDPKDRPLRAKVLKVYKERGKVLVEGVNRVYKHVRRTQKNPQGGRLSMEMPVSMANVMVVCPACNKASRLGARFTDDGAKQRYCKKCGSMVSELSPAHRSHAKK